MWLGCGSRHHSAPALWQVRKKITSDTVEDLQAWGLSPTRGCLVDGGGGQMARTPLAPSFSQMAGGVGETTPEINPRDLAQGGSTAEIRSVGCEGNMENRSEPEGGWLGTWTSPTPLVGTPISHYSSWTPGTGSRSVKYHIPRPLWVVGAPSLLSSFRPLGQSWVYAPPGWIGVAGSEAGRRVYLFSTSHPLLLNLVEIGGGGWG